MHNMTIKKDGSLTEIQQHFKKVNSGQRERAERERQTERERE